MESGTAETRTETNGTAVEAEAAQSERLERIEVHNPATGELIATIAVASPAQVAETVARVRANQAEWEAIGNRGPLPLAGQAARLDARQPRPDPRHDAGGDRQGPRRRLQRAGLPRRPDQLLRHQGAEVHRRGSGPPPLRAAGREEAAGPVPAPPGGRHHQPLELPADPRARRRDPGPAGRRRGRDQALRVHPARPGRGGQGLEGGDRRPRRARLRAGNRRDRRRPGRRRSTSSSSPAPTAPGAR